ncbi:MAG TPA: histidine kinase [Bryobacteraceae bacterium]|nr:histidine kinase [Bryobacteraceae bacterium]
MMSEKRPTKDKSVADEPQPVLAQKLFAAINEHEAVLARVSRLLHDDVSQILSAVGLQLDAMRMDFRKDAPGLEPRAVEIQELLEQAIEQLRDISNELNPSIVERAGLQFSLDRLAGKVRSRFPGTLRLHFDASLRVPTILAKAFYKMTECALEIAIASGCSLIDIYVKRSHGEYVLEITHNGTAAEANGNPETLGWLLMEYYASKNHVSLKVQRTPDKRNIVRASFPLPVAATEGGT